MAEETKTPETKETQVAGTAVAGSGGESKVTTPSSIRAGGKEYGSTEELVKAYESANSELGKWTQQHGDLKKQYDESAAVARKWNEWWQTIQPLWGDDVEGLLRQKLTGQARGQARQAASPQHTQQAQPAATTFEGYELLRPEEQATKMQQVVTAQIADQLNRAWQDYAQGLQQQLAQKEQWYQSYLTNHLGLMRKALERKLQDPKFDVDKVMEQSVRALSGQIDPLELGHQLLSAGSMQQLMDEAKKESYAQGRKDFEQEVANKKAETVPSISTAPPMYKKPEVPTSGTRHGLGSMRQRAAEALAKQFGPGVFTE